MSISTKWKFANIKKIVLFIKKIAYNGIEKIAVLFYYTIVKCYACKFAWQKNKIFKKVVEL